MLKRLTDLGLAIAGLVILSPLLILLAVLVKSTSSGPVLYGGMRVGLHGRRFRMWKFRSMVSNADRIGGPSTAGDDARVTPVGRFLRRYKLDELPQLLNVVAGQMSLVGPRPEVPVYVDMFTPEERAILSVRPGMTDWASLWNVDEGAVLAGEPDPERAYLEKIRPEKIRLQLEYVRRRSFAVDMQILADTALAVLGRRRAPALDTAASAPVARPRG